MSHIPKPDCQPVANHCGRPVTAVTALINHPYLWCVLSLSFSFFQNAVFCCLVAHSCPTEMQTRCNPFVRGIVCLFLKKIVHLLARSKKHASTFWGAYTFSFMNSWTGAIIFPVFPACIHLQILLARSQCRRILQSAAATQLVLLTVTRYSVLQHTATHYNTLQHAAKH